MAPLHQLRLEHHRVTKKLLILMVSYFYIFFNVIQVVQLILAPPPSYDSLFGRVREAQKTSKGVIDFIKNILIILLGTCKYCIFFWHFEQNLCSIFLLVGCTIILGVTIVVPICMIVMGSVYLRECPQGEYIPVYLLVGGKWKDYFL